MKRYGNPQVIVTDKCPSYCAAMKEIGNTDRQEVGGNLASTLTGVALSQTINGAQQLPGIVSDTMDSAGQSIQNGMSELENYMENPLPDRGFDFEDDE